jgi:hypothetical protein
MGPAQPLHVGNDRGHEGLGADARPAGRTLPAQGTVVGPIPPPMIRGAIPALIRGIRHHCVPDAVVGVPGCAEGGAGAGEGASG